MLINQNKSKQGKSDLVKITHLKIAQHTSRYSMQVLSHTMGDLVVEVPEHNVHRPKKPHISDKRRQAERALVAKFLMAGAFHDICLHRYQSQKNSVNKQKQTREDPVLSRILT